MTEPRHHNVFKISSFTKILLNVKAVKPDKVLISTNLVVLEALSSTKISNTTNLMTIEY
jgi:hypothetical protein